MSNNKLALLGDEAVALGAIHAGISAAYGYPGTPSSEILQYLINEFAMAVLSPAGAQTKKPRWKQLWEFPLQEEEAL